MIKPLFFSFISTFLLSGSLKALTTPTSDLCTNAPELKKTFEFLEKEVDLGLTLPQRLELSREVSKGCSGASERFAQIFKLMNKSGVDLKHSLEVALQFSKEKDESFKSFQEFFSVIYLKEGFDMDFESAFRLALELSKNFTGNTARAREDFEKTLKFCQKKSGLSLPIKQCAEISFQVTRQSPFFPQGSFGPFEQTFWFLRQDKRLELSVKEALETTLQVIKYGPTSPQNFRESFDFAMSARAGLSLKSSQALKLALEQARASLRSDDKSATPPIYE